jgi:predicted nucleic acid-binding protein
MKYVLDASAALRCVLPTAVTPRALRLIDEFVQQIHELIAPSHFSGEVANALTKAERQKLIAVGDAYNLIAKVLRSPPLFFPYEPLLYRAVDISSQTRAGFYDCLYVALGERENCEVVTADDKLLKNVQKQFPFVRALTSLP